MLTVMPTPDPLTYVEQWVQAWNAHDIDAVLSHFHDDVVFTSPVAARLLPETGGVVRGKPALRDYWMTALKSLPDLHFDVVGLYRGESTLVINYRNERGGLVNEASDLGALIHAQR
jgi:ketosteroid isomerase-like protein